MYRSTVRFEKNYPCTTQAFGLAIAFGLGRWQAGSPGSWLTEFFNVGMANWCASVSTATDSVPASSANDGVIHAYTFKSERALDPGIKKKKTSRGRHAWRKNPGFPAGIATMDTSEST